MRAHGLFLATQDSTVYGRRRVRSPSRPSALVALSLYLTVNRSPRRSDPTCPHQVGGLFLATQWLFYQQFLEKLCPSSTSTTTSTRTIAYFREGRPLCRPIFLLVKEPKLRTGLETHGQRQFALFRVECQELPGPKMQRGGHMQNVEGSIATVHRIVAAQALRFN